VLGGIERHIPRTLAHCKYLFCRRRIGAIGYKRSIEAAAQNMELVRRRATCADSAERLGRRAFGSEAVSLMMCSASVRAASTQVISFSVVSAIIGVLVMEGRTLHVLRTDPSNIFAGATVRRQKV